MFSPVTISWQGMDGLRFHAVIRHPYNLAWPSMLTMGVLSIVAGKTPLSYLQHGGTTSRCCYRPGCCQPGCTLVGVGPPRRYIVYSTLLAHTHTPVNVLWSMQSRAQPTAVRAPAFPHSAAGSRVGTKPFLFSQEAAGAYDAEAKRVFGDAHPPLNFPVSKRRMFGGGNIRAIVGCAVHHRMAAW